MVNSIQATYWTTSFMAKANFFLLEVMLMAGKNLLAILNMECFMEMELCFTSMEINAQEYGKIMNKSIKVRKPTFTSR